MPDPTAEQQALGDASAALVAAYASLAAEIAAMTKADNEYEQVAKDRNNASTTFTDANKAFVANPADPKALTNFETTAQALLALSRKVQQLRSAKDQTDASDSAAQQDYNAKLADLHARFNAFVAANSPPSNG